MALPSAGSTRRPRGLTLFSVAFCFLCALTAQAVQPGVSKGADRSAGNLVFILDASGSMGAQIQGRMKIDIAKEVLTGLIRDLPETVKVGLVAYGHRQKSDCEDVEELIPLGPLDKESTITKIKALDHKGKTPITYSVRKVAETLKTLEDETTIVLVSDGEETCEGDPCQLVKELKASGVKFEMHVIGFDVAEKEKAQLACIAQAGGGSYFTAKNAGELGVAARKAVEKPDQSTGKLRIKAIRNGKPFDAWYEVFKAKADDDEEVQSLASNPIGKDGETVKLAPGVYDLRIIDQDEAGRPALEFKGITVEAGKSVEKTADFSGGTLKIKATRNGKPFNGWYEVFKPKAEDEEEQQSVASNPLGEEGETVKLTPGVYDLRIIDQEDAGRPTVDFKGITIEAGKSLEKTADFSGGTLKVKVLRNGKPFNGWYDIYKTGAEDDEEEESVASNPIGNEGEVVKLSPGIYDLKITDQEDAGSPAITFAGITIEAGKTVEKVGEFSGGTLRIKALKKGKPFSADCYIFKATEDNDESKELVINGWCGAGDDAGFKLTSALYDVVVEDVESNQKKEFNKVNIEPAKVQTLEVQF